MVPPFIPELKNETDCSNFDEFEEKEHWLDKDAKDHRGLDFNYIGFT